MYPVNFFAPQASYLSELELITIADAGGEDTMKKVAATVVLAITLLLINPGDSDAEHSQDHGGKYVTAHYGVRGGYQAWRGYPGYWRPRPYGGFRFYWGAPVVVGPPFLPYPYYSPPPVIIRERPPVTVPPEQRIDTYWYYCQNPQGYYPYVKSCPEGWMKVVPQPTPPNP